MRSHLGILVMVVGLGVATTAAVFKTRHEVLSTQADVRQLQSEARSTISTSWAERDYHNLLASPQPLAGERDIDWLERHFALVEQARTISRRQ